MTDHPLQSEKMKTLCTLLVVQIPRGSSYTPGCKLDVSSTGENIGNSCPVCWKKYYKNCGHELVTERGEGRVCKVWFHLITGYSGAVSKRKIYTLFTDRKTWNEAKTICESQYGQLVKIKTQTQIEELRYLDSLQWENRVNNELPSLGVWSALHMPYMNSTWTYQDCEPISDDVTVSVSGSLEKCSTIKPSYTLTGATCEEEKTFICQRYEGDCWYAPFFEEEPKVFLALSSTTIIDPNIDATTCAVECRNFYDATSGSECWGFTFYPNTMCMLHVDNTPYASSNYLKSTNRKSGPQDSTFYVRRCFEGSLDTEVYDSFLNVNPEPESSCTTTPYSADDTTSDACYCSTKEQPPIPEPISSEEKAKQLEQELTINPTNTSAALRKLTSAEDNRPSAVGVGYLGVGLMAMVFGSLFLLDLPGFLAGIKGLFCTSADTQNVMNGKETDC